MIQWWFSSVDVCSRWGIHSKTPCQLQRNPSWLLHDRIRKWDTIQFYKGYEQLSWKSYLKTFASAGFDPWVKWWPAVGWFSPRMPLKPGVKPKFCGEDGPSRSRNDPDLDLLELSYWYMISSYQPWSIYIYYPFNSTILTIHKCNYTYSPLW